MPMIPVDFRDLKQGGHYFLRMMLRARYEKLRVVVDNPEIIDVMTARRFAEVHVTSDPTRKLQVYRHSGAQFYQDTASKINADREHVGPRVKEIMKKTMRTNVLHAFQKRRDAEIDAAHPGRVPAHYTKRMKRLVRKNLGRGEKSSTGKRMKGVPGHTVSHQNLIWKP